MEKNEEMKNSFMTSKDKFNEKIIFEKHIFGLYFLNLIKNLEQSFIFFILEFSFFT